MSSTREQLDFLKTTYLDDELISHAHVVVATKVAAAIAYMFELQGELVRVIPHEENGQVNPAVIYVGDGLNEGDWSTINHPANDDKFMLEIGEGPGSIIIDSRRDMDYPLFQNMTGILQTEAALRKREYRPELIPKAYSNEIPRSFTWLTGYAEYAEEGEDEDEKDAADSHMYIGVVQSTGETTSETVTPQKLKLVSAKTGFRPAVIIRDALVMEYTQLNPIDDFAL